MTAPFAPALAEMLKARYAAPYRLKVQRSRLLDSHDWISLFSTLG